MDLQLSGKTAIVTGGSKGIGLATVRTLLDEGMRVVSASRSVTPELAATPATAVTVDLSTAEGARELVDAAIAELGGIDVVVNNVGIGDVNDLVEGATGNVLEVSDSAWERMFTLHFYSALWVCRAALPSLIERRGTIINVSSAAAHHVGRGPFHYNVSKLALNALTEILAVQFGPQGVRAITVSPGLTKTGHWTDPDGFIAQMAGKVGAPHAAFAEQMLTNVGPTTGRVTTPEEVAQLISFAASPSNISGAEYVIGGRL